MDEIQEPKGSPETEREPNPADKAKGGILESVKKKYRAGQGEEAAEKSGELPDEAGDERNEEPRKQESERIDLNTASAEELSQLPGIGPALAQRIIDYRTEVHPFEEPNQITVVSGISAATYERLAERLTVAMHGEVELEGEALEKPPAPEEEKAEVEATAAPPEEVEEEGAPVSEREPETAKAKAAVPPPRRPSAPARPAVVVQQGVGWGPVLLVGLLSVIAGAVLALVALVVINNGTLAFRATASRELRQEAFQLSGELQTLRAELGQVQNQLSAMSGLATQLNAAQTDIQNLAGTLTAAQTQIDSIGSSLGEVQTATGNLRTDLDGLASTTADLGQRVDTAQTQLEAISADLDSLRASAERFDVFLAGMRALLDQAMGATPSAAPLPSATLETLTPLATPSALATEQTPEPGLEATAAPPPTYTPELTPTLAAPTPTPTP